MNILIYLARVGVSQCGTPATGAEGLLGDGVAEEDQSRPHHFLRSTCPRVEWEDFLGVCQTHERLKRGRWEGSTAAPTCGASVADGRVGGGGSRGAGAGRRHGWGRDTDTIKRAAPEPKRPAIGPQTRDRKIPMAKQGSGEMSCRGPRAEGVRPAE
jgi:hypothetical protein